MDDLITEKVNLQRLLLADTEQMKLALMINESLGLFDVSEIKENLKKHTDGYRDSNCIIKTFFPGNPEESFSFVSLEDSRQNRGKPINVKLLNEETVFFKNRMLFFMKIMKIKHQIADIETDPANLLDQLSEFYK